ncbi:MAG: polyprenyl synthetase family protein [Bacteroidota bacterium]|nr:polyprenyl synthetase family protein [Bacteroidota bacterium]
MYSLEELRHFIHQAAKDLEVSREPKELYQPIQYVFQTGGKRLRPVLSLMACNLFNDQVDQAVMPALGLEVFHNFTLLHDDIMDGAILRRNQATVHEKWDQNIAILSGDVMAIMAYEYITNCPVDILPEVIRIFNITARSVCEGQQYDMNFEKQIDVSTEDYLKMIEKKTSVLLAACLQIGALIGGAPKPDAEQLYDFGLNLGMAFQLQDDILDSFGNPELFGKEIGGDIKSNKKTWLLIKTLEMAKPGDKKKLVKLLAGTNRDDEGKVDEILSLYNMLGIKELAEKLVQFYFNKARTNLNNVRVSNERKSILRELTDSLMNREK